MQLCSKVLIGLSAMTLLIGAVLLVLTASGIAPFNIVWTDRLLTAMYNPDDHAGCQDLQKYENLYRWTRHIIHHRNHIVVRLHYTEGVAFVIVGMLLIAWTVDRERLYHRLRTHDDQATQAKGPGACS